MAAATYGVLGQQKPSGSLLTTLYTVPAGRKTIARVIVCNQGAISLFRVVVEVGGAPDAPANYMAYDEQVNANDSVSSVPIGLNGGDVLNVQSDTGNVSFSVTGIEQDQ